MSHLEKHVPFRCVDRVSVRLVHEKHTEVVHSHRGSGSALPASLPYRDQASPVLLGLSLLPFPGGCPLPDCCLLSVFVVSCSRACDCVSTVILLALPCFRFAHSLRNPAFLHVSRLLCSILFALLRSTDKTWPTKYERWRKPFRGI